MIQIWQLYIEVFSEPREGLGAGEGNHFAKCRTLVLTFNKWRVNMNQALSWTTEFYREWLGALASKAAQTLRNWHDAEDVAHATLCHASSKFNPSRGSFRSYVFGVLRNKIKKFLSKEYVRRCQSIEFCSCVDVRTPLNRLVVSETDDLDHLSMLQRETVEILLSGQGLRVMSAKQQQVVDLYSQGLSVSDIAKQLKIPSNTVRKRLKDIDKKRPIRGTALTKRERRVLEACMMTNSQEEAAQSVGVKSWRISEILSQIRAKAFRIESHLGRINQEPAL